GSVTSATAVTMVAAMGLLGAFALSVDSFARPSVVVPPGAASLWGVPWVVLLFVFFTLALTAGVSLLAGARPGTVLPADRPFGLAVLMIFAGCAGLWAALDLTVSKVRMLTEQTPILDCNFSLLVQCGANLESWQGSVFGFPNPLLGLVGWSCITFVGIALLAGAAFARWFWVVLVGGVTAAVGFVIWLITQSIFILGTLCPWCMVTWAVTIPVFWALTFYAAREGVWGVGTAVQKVAPSLYLWTPCLTLLSYITIALVAQLRLDVLAYL
ncbi:MAG: hypothetical protein JWP30_1090, partial [Homoserinimonas sp.]|nr:hypothetical protein [Homoserinimonas sp.]